jgi:hypothetical protein
VVIERPNHFGGVAYANVSAHFGEFSNDLDRLLSNCSNPLAVLVLAGKDRRDEQAASRG